MAFAFWCDFWVFRFTNHSWASTNGGKAWNPPPRKRQMLGDETVCYIKDVPLSLGQEIGTAGAPTR